VPRIIGIDLGTTNSCVAVLDDKGQPRTLAAADGERTTPSWIAWAANGQVTVGTRARRQAVTNASATVFGAKRLIGRKVNAEDVAQFGFHKPTTGRLRGSIVNLTKRGQLCIAKT